MISLIAYRKSIDAIHTHELRLPIEAGQPAGQELTTLADGRTVVALFGAASLPEDQPAEIIASIETLPTPLPQALHDEIKAASPACHLIAKQVVDKIRARYSADDEIKLLRLAPSPETTAWNAYVEECRQWGREQRARLGL